ncbi:MAG: hypothetical protein ACHQEM_01980 [Chitinophagales bacterium]
MRIIEERMNENELNSETQMTLEPSSPDSGPSQTAHVTKGNRVFRLIREMWPAYLIEILVIILGISITLALEEWRELGKEQKLERVYLSNLLTNIESDLNSLRYASSATQDLLKSGFELMQFVNEPVVSKMNNSKLDSNLKVLLSRPKFIAQDATFSDLKSSGNLRLIRDVQFKNLLFDYYNRGQNIKENQDAEQQATIMLVGPYFLKRFAMDDGSRPQAVKAKSLVDMNTLPLDIEFRNNVLLRVSNREELFRQYRAADSVANLLRRELLKKVS